MNAYLKSLACALGVLALTGTSCSKEEAQRGAGVRHEQAVQAAVAFNDGQSQELPAHGSLPIYELQIESRSLSGLESTAHSDNTVPGTFRAEGEVYTPVRVRYRGAFALSSYSG